MVWKVCSNILYIELKLNTGMSCICTHCTLINCVWISIVFISVGSIYIKASNETEDDYYHEDEDNNSNGSGTNQNLIFFVNSFCT